MNGLEEAPVTKQVRFAPAMVEVKQIDKPTREENEAKWYSEEAHAMFGRSMLRNAIKYDFIMTANNSSILQDRELFHEHVINCVGLDLLLQFVNPTQRIHAIRHSRAQHVRVVLGAQSSYGYFNDGGQDNIARLSEESSRFTRERANRVAMLAASMV